MKRSIFQVLILLLAIAVSVVGCQRLPFASETVNSTTVTVKLSSWSASPSEQKLLKRVLREFETQHPGIKVKHEV
ncbi:MAG: ABC transporter substrate-binding protein, partial [Calothrix sp. SM1_7_51]|nr:ABC transporter substrate-binding protein [Calothrix sp. SM1_7_51]